MSFRHRHSLIAFEYNISLFKKIVNIFICHFYEKL